MQFLCLICLFSLCCHSTKAFTKIHQSSAFNPHSHTHATPNQPFSKPQRRDVESFLWSSTIGVRYVLNVGRCDYRYVLGGKCDCRSLIQLLAQSAESVGPSSFTHFSRPSSSLIPHTLALFPSFASGWKSGEGILSFKEQLHTFLDPQMVVRFIYGWQQLWIMFIEHSKISGPHSFGGITVY